MQMGLFDWTKSIYVMKRSFGGSNRAKSVGAKNTSLLLISLLMKRDYLKWKSVQAASESKSYMYESLEAKASKPSDT